MAGKPTADPLLSASTVSSMPWWNRPALPAWFVLVCVALVIARKPWAVLHPQFFAEDGSVFMIADQQDGLKAFIEPYQGYLHFLPRLTAWVASHTLDPRWWPGCYNGAAFLATALVFMRLASRRVDLPAKPWLALAIALVPHTGEVIGTITDVQWLTAFLLVVQLFTTRAAGAAQRVIDGIIVVVAALTGPFSLLFVPFFAWKAWVDRNPETKWLLVLVTVCAVIQGVFVARTGPHFDYQNKPWDLAGLGGIVGTRLVVWPLLGPTLLTWIPPLALRAVSVGLLAFLIWQLRPGERRSMRVQLTALLLIVLGAGVYRIRADTWVPYDIEHGDRYFFISRVLLGWLLVLEVCRLGPLAWRTGAAVAAFGLAMNLSTFVLPTPPDYDWAAHCDPIRRGEPARLPTLPKGWIVDYRGRAKHS